MDPSWLLQSHAAYVDRDDSIRQWGGIPYASPCGLAIGALRSPHALNFPRMTSLQHYAPCSAATVVCRPKRTASHNPPSLCVENVLLGAISSAFV